MKKILLLLLFMLVFRVVDTICQPCTNPTGPGGDDCSIATPVCDPVLGFDEYCDQLDNNGAGGTPFPGCPANVLNNDEWFVFVASGPSLNLTITPSNCGQVSPNNPGVQAAMYEGSCSGSAIATQCDCTTAPFVLSGPTTPGNTYYIVIDGCAGDVCDYSVQDNNGTTIPVPPPDLVPMGPTQVCPGLITNYTLPIANADIYTWTLSNSALGMFQTIPPMGASMDIEWMMEGTVDICVTGTNACGLSSTMPAPVCLTVDIVQPPDVNDNTAGCVGDFVTCMAAPNNPQEVLLNPYTAVIPLTDAVGCNYNVLCLIEPLIPAPVDQGQVELCGPGNYEVCPGEFLFDSGIYNVTCADPATGCDVMVMVDLAIFQPDAIIATPVPVLDCGGGSTVMLDGSNSTLFVAAPGATLDILWTGPGIVGTASDPFVEVDEPGQYCLTITMARNGTECTDQACVTVTENSTVPNPPLLTGTANPCEGVTYQYDANPNGAPAPTGYTWTTPNGEPFTIVDANTIEVDWTGSAGGDLCVVGTSSCGNSAPTCITITIGEAPNVPTINGPVNVCAVNQSETYTITNPQTGSTYAWTVPPGASFNGSGTTITVNFNGAALGSAQVCATATNPCGTSAAGCFDVEIASPPPTPVMSGPSPVCSNGTGYTYTVSNSQPNDTFNWTAPAGATVNGTGASVEIDFNGASTGQVCVTVVNDCGNSVQTCQNVTVQQVPVATISGSGELCEGVPANINLTISVTGTAPWDVEYTVDGANPTMITINSSPYTLTVNQPGVYELTSLSGGSGGCTGSVQGTATIVENPLPTAALSGTDDICENSNEQGELTIELTGSGPWEVTWASNMVAQAPLTINASPYTLLVSEAQAGNITLTGVTDSNNCDGTVSGSGEINVIQAPIVSNVTRTCDATNTNYTVTINIQGGDPATYSVTPANGMLNGNTFVSNPIFSGLNYSFTVTDANDCNPVVVQGTFLCNCESAAGQMNTTPIEVCGDGPVSAAYNNANEFLDGNDVLRFIMHSGNGTNIVPPIVGDFASPDNISFDPASMSYGVTYRLSAVVGDDDGMGSVDQTDPCLDVSLGTPITFFEIPTATLSGIDTVCQGSNGQLTVTFTGEGPWEISYDNGTGVQTISGINANPFTLNVTPPDTGLNTFCLTAMNDSNCPGNVSGCGDVQVNTGVSVDNLMVTCNNTATGFVVSFNISGGDPNSYVVTGAPGTITNGVFTSDEISTGPGIGFALTVDDANSCAPQNVSQTEVVCDCISDAGTMDLTLVTTCGNGPITVSDAQNPMLDGDDVLIYVLHSGVGAGINGILGVNVVPVFPFNPANMVYGTTYYISAVVGNSDGAGGIDVMDPCLSVAPGTPIIFYEIPTATLSGGGQICPGETTDLMVDLTGDSPWSVTINGVVYDNINGSPFTVPVTPAATTVYQLTDVRDSNCDNVLTEEQTITVHEPPTVTLDSEDCNATGTAYTVCFTITGGDASCYQVTPSNGTLTGNQFCSTEIPDGNGYSFSVTDCQGCPPAVISALEVTCDCPTMAGDFTAAPIEVCRNAMTPASLLNEYDDSNQLLDPDDALCFFLHSGNNVPLATNPNEPVFGFNPGNMMLGQTYFICPVAGNDDGSGCVDFSDPCRSIGGCVEVVFNALPTATLSGTVGICQGDDPELTINLTGIGPWTVRYQNSAGTVFNEVAPSSPYTLDVVPNNSTVITLVSVTDANGCSNNISGNSATVNVNLPPQVSNITEDCNQLETEFTVSFTITGGNPATYTVDPAGTIAGNVYTSTPIPTNSNYTFLVDDANGCGPTIVDGGHACDCFTQAGVMQQQGALTVCGTDQSTGAVYNDMNELLDPDDVRIFVLLSSGSAVFDPSNIVEVNANEPFFGFNPATMQYGTTYFIASVVGNSDGMGAIDYDNDFCLSVSNNIPVTFYPLPTVSIAGPAAICEGDLADIEITVTGNGPFSVDYLLNGIPQTVGPINAAGTTTVQAPIPATSTLTLVSVQDNFCSNQANESITVQVNPQVEAGSSSIPLEFCEGVNQTVILSDQLNGEDPGGVWTNQSGQVIPNGSINVGSLSPNVQNIFTYTVSGMPPCPDDMADVQIDITAAPVADAGPDLFLNCDITEVTLSTGNTTPGAATTWTGTGITNPTDPNPTVTNPGTFTLTATIGNCTDTDVMIVSENISMPVAVVQANPVSCFGETDGFAIVESVVGGVPPYLFSLDGGPFVNQQSFLGLAPGDHTITVEDNSGCTMVTAFEIIEPAEVTVDIISNIPVNQKQVIPLGESAVLTAVTTPGFSTLDTIIWSPAGIDSACVGCPTITVSPNQQTAYSVLVDLNGCRDEAIFTVFISKDRPVFVPNAFSPNDDLINDVLHVYGGDNVAEIKSFLVFNRWGESVYEFYDFQPAPRDFTVGWDGKLRGEHLNPGVFVWFAEVVFIDGSVGLYEGDVTLIRSN